MSSPPPVTVPSPETPPPPPSTVELILPPPGSSAEPLTTAAARPSSSSRSTLLALGVGIGIGGTIVLLCVGIFVIWYRKRKRKLAYALPKSRKEDHFDSPRHHWQQPAALGYSLNTQTSSLSETDGNSSSLAKTIFSYEELVLATVTFAESNLLGQGGFGYVHKGVLNDGKHVAIKQLKVGSGQGEREFQSEVDIISRVSHNNLVGLVGYCISGVQRLLVYEYVPNRTLEYHLHGKKKPSIDWTTRMKIAIGSAKGLAYLHEDCRPKIVHRDIKSANILLDENFEAKVADFGLARLYSDTDTHVSTRVMGTFGYLAPEYALTGKLTDKSDVFSYGVVLLELITGRRPIDRSQHYLDDNIIDWARPLLTQALEEDSFDTLADPRLQKDYNHVEMSRMVACASACVRHFARRRPRMSQIASALEGNLPLDDLNKGIRTEHSAIYGSHESSDFDISYDTTQYREDLIKFKKMAFESTEQNTTEHSALTIEITSQSTEPSVEIVQTNQESQQPSANHC